jgi:hypothetical protein
MAIKMSSNGGVFYHRHLFVFTLAAAGAIRSDKLPNGGVQRLPV